jgi:tRNA modification GTPase
MPEIHLDDTIAAIATPPGEGGLGVVRLSGPQAARIAKRMLGTLGEPRVATFGTVQDEHRAPIDQAVVTFFARPKSYTAEDVVEISAHGGAHVLGRILKTCVSLGARHAEPGEFTRRAFLNGRIDLTQAEAVLDLIRSKTDRSLEVAMSQLEGKLSRELSGIKDALMHAHAHLEAYLDFPDDDLEIYSNQELLGQLERINTSLRRLIASYSKGELLREGALVVIVGRPNVGKSSLLNALLDRDRAIVSEIPGTTRDVLEESIDLNGLWIRVADTAGLGESKDPLDQAGMQRTRQYLEDGDLFIWMIDGSVGCTDEDRSIKQSLNGKPVLTIVNKVDLPGQKKIDKTEFMNAEEKAVRVSCKTKEGIELLEKTISEAVLSDELGAESILITRLRHKEALEVSIEALEKSRTALNDKMSLEFVALDLKRSLDALRELIGEIYSEDLLDVIFREFCIGK